MSPTRRLDRALGRLFMRGWAVLALLAAVGASILGAVVLVDGHLIGLVILSAGTLFFWLGLRAWRDRATLGDLLNRDFERTEKDRP